MDNVSLEADDGLRKRKRTNTVPEYEPEPTTVTEMVKAWPKATFCIISNEFCERFSYYGMRTVLTLYLINILNFSDDNSTIMFHAFTVLAYTSPLIGSILADGYIGKFWTIFSVSILYTLGQAVLAFAATFKKTSSVHPWLDLTGLFIIAMGTGGIKPCVSAFGGDQFSPNHIKMISLFFSIFYFMINAGSTISTFLTPEFRALPCLGQDSCYPLAFGIPAALMITATIAFMLGSFFYKKLPPKENVIFRVVGTMKTALVNKFRSGAPKRAHWTEHFLDRHDCQRDAKCTELQLKTGNPSRCAQAKFVADVQSLIKVTVMMVPVPFFWALYDQQGSRWVIQAIAMDAQITSGFALLPDQMAVLNAILIMAFIPIFQLVIYPLFEKLNIKTTPLRRMAIGGLLAAASFGVCGFVQLGVNKTLPDTPASGQAFLSFVNGYDTKCNVTYQIPEINSATTLSFNSSLIDDKVNNRKELLRIPAKKYNVQLTFAGDCYGAEKTGKQVLPIALDGGNYYYVSAAPEGYYYTKTDTDKPTEGQGQNAYRFDLLLPCTSIKNATVAAWGGCNGTSDPHLNSYNGRLALCRYDPNHDGDANHPCNPREASDYYVWKSEGDDYSSISYKALYKGVFQNANYTSYDFRDVKSGVFRLYYVHYDLGDSDRTPARDQISTYMIPDFTFEIKGMGGVYAMVISNPGDVEATNKKVVFTTYTIVPKNHVSILWQIPQYVVITAAEILFSITGLEFSYSQAAPSMKSVVQAIWLLTVAFGDLIIIIIAEADLFSNLAIEMFAYAGAMVVVIGIFLLMAIFYYDYVDYSAGDNDDEAQTLTRGSDSLNKNYDSVSEKSFDTRF